MELLEKAIGTILKANTSITDVVTINGIYHGRIGQDVNDDNTVIRYEVEDVDPQERKGSQGAQIDKFFVRFDVFGRNTDEVLTVAKAIRDVLDRYSHTEVSGVRLRGTRFESSVFDGDVPDAIDQVRRSLIMSFRVARTP